MKTESSAAWFRHGRKNLLLSLKDNKQVKRFWKSRFLLLLFLPTFIYYILFKYVPIWGISIALYDYNIWAGLEGSKYIGLRNFELFFASPDCFKITKNTFVLGMQSLLVSFPITILFSLLLNEIKSDKFKKFTQTISYMPHFLSTVVICGLVVNFCDPTTGLINTVIKLCGGKSIYFITQSKWFRPIYLISEIWQGLGWGSIVYLAAISNVDPVLYEAARLDGAGRWRQMVSITLPAIAPTVATMLILKVGRMMNDSLEKVLLLQVPSTYDVSQTISTYVYQVGLERVDYDYSAAVNLYSSLINLVLLVGANWISKKLTETSIF